MHSESTWFTSVRSLAETDSPGRAQTETRLAASPGVSDSPICLRRLVWILGREERQGGNTVSKYVSKSYILQAPAGYSTAYTLALSAEEL